MAGFKCIIMGAAGRDFHDYLRFFRGREGFRVCCFTAHQIPFIEQRSFPRSLAGTGYDEDIPIFSEQKLPELIERYQADFVFLSYSDLPHEEVMHRASIVQAAGASFALLGPRHTQLRSERPVVAVTAVRTGAGKSPLCQALAQRLSAAGVRPGIVRHPMPYGTLELQAVQRFSEPADLDRHACTIEEREEYVPYLDLGLSIWAGVDYAAILRELEPDCDMVLWDGGNNDTSFVRANYTIVVADAMRPGHEMAFYPGETNFRAGDVIVINKVEGAPPGAVDQIRASAGQVNPEAPIVEADLAVELESPEVVRGKRVLVVEDGPTLTHGGMASGAGLLAAERAGAAEVIDPRPHAVGTIADAFERYPHLGPVLPALGYSDAQRSELAATIIAAAPDYVVDASPATLRGLQHDVPLLRTRYRFVQRSGPDLLDLVRQVL